MRRKQSWNAADVGTSSPNPLNALDDSGGGDDDDGGGGPLSLDAATPPVGEQHSPILGRDMEDWTTATAPGPTTTAASPSPLAAPPGRRSRPRVFSDSASSDPDDDVAAAQPSPPSNMAAAAAPEGQQPATPPPAAATELADDDAVSAPVPEEDGAGAAEEPTAAAGAAAEEEEVEDAAGADDFTAPFAPLAALPATSSPRRGTSCARRGTVLGFAVRAQASAAEAVRRASAGADGASDAMVDTRTADAAGVALPLSGDSAGLDVASLDLDLVGYASPDAGAVGAPQMDVASPRSCVRGWSAAIDPGTRAMYYYHSSEGSVTWNMPPVLTDDDAAFLRTVALTKFVAGEGEDGFVDDDDDDDDGEEDDEDEEEDEEEEEEMVGGDGGAEEAVGDQVDENAAREGEDEDCASEGGGGGVTAAASVTAGVASVTEGGDAAPPLESINLDLDLDLDAMATQVEVEGGSENESDDDDDVLSDQTAEQAAGAAAVAVAVAQPESESETETETEIEPELSQQWPAVSSGAALALGVGTAHDGVSQDSYVLCDCLTRRGARAAASASKFGLDAAMLKKRAESGSATALEIDTGAADAESSDASDGGDEEECDPSRVQSMYAVYDGHGRGGECVSAYLQHHLAFAVTRQPTFLDDPVAALTRGFLEIDAELGRCFADASGPCSLAMAGSTATTVLLRGRTLWCANLGDSTGILVKHEKLSATQVAARTFSKQSLVALKASKITVDHKPDDEEEAIRIEANGGVVGDARGGRGDSGAGPVRVWKHDPAAPHGQASYPGLAMSRSFGDTAAHECGVISIPTIKTLELDPTVDAFLVLASDGVWDVMSEKKVCKILEKCVARSDDEDSVKWAATTIKNKCRKLWRTKDGGGYSDDISVVVVRLGEPNAAAPSAADGRVGRGARRGSGSGSSGKSKGLLLEGLAARLDATSPSGGSGGDVSPTLRSLRRGKSMRKGSVRKKGEASSGDRWMKRLQSKQDLKK